MPVERARAWRQSRRPLDLGNRGLGVPLLAEQSHRLCYHPRSAVHRTSISKYLLTESRSCWSDAQATTGVRRDPTARSGLELVAGHPRLEIEQQPLALDATAVAGEGAGRA